MRIDLIEQRKKKLNRESINESFISNSYLENKCLQNPNDFSSFEKIIKNYNNSNSFTNLLDIACESMYKNTMISRLYSIMINESNINNIITNIENRNDESLSKLLEHANDIKTCDRILCNETTIEQMINVSKIIRENKLYTDDDKVTLIEELCDQINSFNCESKIKVNLCLENIPYILYKKGIRLDDDIIYETINNYFINKEDVDYVIEINHSFFKKSKDKLKKPLNTVKNKLLQLKDIKTPEPIKQILRFMYTQSPDQILEDIPNFLTWLRTFLGFSTFAINPYLGIVIMIVDQFIAHNMKINETDRCIKIFEKEKEKSQRKLERLSSNKAKKNLEDYIKSLDKSINKLKEYRTNLKDDEQGDDDMFDEMTVEKRKAIDYYNEGVEGYRPYFINKETFYKNYKNKFDAQYETMCNKLLDYSNKYRPIKDKVTIAHENKLLNIDPSYCIIPEGNIMLNVGTIFSNSIGNCVKEMEKYLDTDNYSLSAEKRSENRFDIILLSRFGLEDVESIYHSLISNTELVKESAKAIEYLYENSDKVFIEQLDQVLPYLDRNDIKNISMIANSNPFINRENYNYTLNESCNIKDFSKAKAIKEAAKYNKVNSNMPLLGILTLQESVKELEESFSLLNINEASSIRNNLLLIKEKIKKNAQKISDKDKQYSRQLDNLVSNAINKTQKELTNKNREAVIKGTLLPSLSAAIKLALASGALAVVNPVLGLITLVGGVACAKIGTKKEQQYILDEIEIELKLVDKKIQLAERNDDTKALEQLYKIEKALKREETRIKYHKKDFRPVTDN